MIGTKILTVHTDPSLGPSCQAGFGERLTDGVGDGVAQTVGPVAGDLDDAVGGHGQLVKAISAFTSSATMTGSGRHLSSLME